MPGALRRSTTTALLVATGLVVAHVPAVATAHAAPRALTPHLFTSDRDGDNEIYTRGVSGSPLKLTNNRFDDDFGAVWSPDGTRIAFVSGRDGDRDVFVMNANGSAVRLLTQDAPTEDGAPVNDQAPAWSPDGNRIAFVSTRDGGEPEIYVMDADGTDPQRLTRTEAWVSDHTPSWSPDGHIVFSSDRVSYENYELFRMDADGSDVTRLTTTEDGIDDNAPEYSPDGSRIVFSSTRIGQQHDLFTMTADGSDVRRLGGDPLLDDVFPHWTSDGSRVLFGTFAGIGGTPSEDVWRIDVDGSDRRRLSTSSTGEGFADPYPVSR